MLNDQPPSRSVFQEWIVNYIASVIDLEPEAIALDRTFHDIGMDSAEVVIMTGVLEEEFAIEVRAELPFEHPTIASFLDALAEKKLIS
ncbi:acyl carrier protein [Oryzicola mucosus]|uniref:Acyl carrier protein n=1 Tax=Oryzicola mucosus TaxID=2767425 RepID=A0A8J6PTK5_9HYPH|nr:acyl carrier protein [Oryzicola mucosus]MBD0415199.1 acyl carrier protein [Oryzicola mucosus]MDI6025694.1 acyl carrier protein [Tianweitania sp. UT-5YL-CI-8]